jgi:hypothetical protein
MKENQRGIRKVLTGCPTRSIGSECRDGIDTHRAARRNDAGDESDAMCVAVR